MASKNDDEMAEKVEQYIKDRWALINEQLKKQKRLYDKTRKPGHKPIRPPREKMTRKTRENLNRISYVLQKTTNFDNLRRILTEYDRWKILVDFYIIADGLKIDSKRRKAPGNKNKDIRFMDAKGNYIFALPIDKFIELRQGTRNSISRNINLFAFLEVIEKRNPYEIEVASMIKQEEHRQDKILTVDGMIKNGMLWPGERKNDFNYTSLYIIPVLSRNILKQAEEKAAKLYQVNFSIRAFSSIFLTMYFGEEEAAKVYFHKNLLAFTEYSNFLQEKIKDAILELIDQKGYATQSMIYQKIKLFCASKEFEIIEKYGRPRVSAWNTFQTEFKRTRGRILQEYPYIKQSNTPTKEMQQVFDLENGNHILYDTRKLKKENFKF